MKERPLGRRQIFWEPWIIQISFSSRMFSETRTFVLIWWWSMQMAENCQTWSARGAKSETSFKKKKYWTTLRKSASHLNTATTEKYCIVIWRVRISSWLGLVCASWAISEFQEFSLAQIRRPTQWLEPRSTSRPRFFGANPTIKKVISGHWEYFCTRWQH